MKKYTYEEHYESCLRALYGNYGGSQDRTAVHMVAYERWRDDLPLMCMEQSPCGNNCWKWDHDGDFREQDGTFKGSYHYFEWVPVDWRKEPPCAEGHRKEADEEYKRQEAEMEKNWAEREQRDFLDKIAADANKTWWQKLFS